MSRCACCKKKLVLDYVCKCGKILCITHLQPENHECTYNFKADGRLELEKKLVETHIVKSKVEKI